MRPALRPPKDRVTLSEVFAGVIIGFDNLGRAVALASLIFAGSLYGGASLATAVFLLSSALGTASLLLPGSFIGPVFSNVQNAAVAILLPAIAAITASGLPQVTQVATVFAVFGGTAVITGIAMVLMGAFDLGRIIRLVPFPVSAGYLAASGALLAVLAVKMVCGEAMCAQSNADGDRTVLALAVAFAAATALITRRWRTYGLVSVIVASVVLFYLALPFLGLSIPDARLAGLLPSGRAAATQLNLDLTLYLNVRWDLVAQAMPLIFSAVLVSIFAAMLNVTGVEIALRQDVPTQRELKRVGVVNALTGAFGATVSFISASNTSSGIIAGAKGRTAGIVTCVVLCVSAVFAGSILAYVPPFVAPGLLMFFGLSILNQWWFQTRQQQSRAEWLVCTIIVVASLVVGMPESVLIGLVMASLIFAVTYARLPVIRSTTDLAHRRSTVDRGPAQSAFLSDVGGEVVVVTLQGYLFFGSIEQLNRHIRGLFDGARTVSRVILDFHRVSRMDASSLAALKKLDIFATSHDVQVVLADLRPEIAADVTRAHLIEPGSSMSLADATDVAMEEAENALILRMEPMNASETVESALARIIGDENAAKRLVAAMDREEVAAGETLIHQGEKSGDMFMLETGALSVYITTAGGDRLRVRKQKPGSIVGEIASYAGVARTADVIADVPSVVYRLTETRLAGFHATEPDLAAYWHRAMATALADKLDRTNTLLGQNVS